MGSMRSEDWASSYVQGQQEGKGKGRAMEPVQQGMGGQYGQQQGYGGYGGALGMGMGGMGMGAGMGMGMGYQPSFQPMYSGMAMQNGQPQHAQHAQQMQSPEQQQQQMEAAFDQAFKDAQIDVGQSQAGKEAQNQGEGQLQEPVQANAEEQAPAEEVREAKGDFEKVWESLKPEAERLGKLAEWEKEFSQVRCLISFPHFSYDGICAIGAVKSDGLGIMSLSVEERSRCSLVIQKSSVMRQEAGMRTRAFRTTLGWVGHMERTRIGDAGLGCRLAAGRENSPKLSRLRLKARRRKPARPGHILVCGEDSWMRKSITDAAVHKRRRRPVRNAQR